MRNYCTVCGGRLQVWERVWGRLDHASCRSEDTAKKAVVPASYAQASASTIAIMPGGELGIRFSNPTSLSSPKDTQASAA